MTGDQEPEDLEVGQPKSATIKPIFYHPRDRNEKLENLFVLKETNQTIEERRLDLLLKLHAASGGNLEYEVGWIVNHTNWLLMAQAFLFVAYATALGECDASSVDHALRVRKSMKYLGILLQVFTMLSLLSADTVSCAANDVHCRHEELLKGSIETFRNPKREDPSRPMWIPALRCGIRDEFCLWQQGHGCRKTVGNWIIQTSWFLAMIARWSIIIACLAAWLYLGEPDYCCTE